MKYLDKNTFFHRLDPRTKLIMSLACSCLIIILNKPLLLSLLALALFAIFMSLHPSYNTVRTIITIMGIAFVGTVLSQGLFYGFEPRTPVFTILNKKSGFLGWFTGGIVFYREGFIYGVIQSTRLFSALLLSVVVVMTTYPSDLILGLKSLGLPDRIGFVILVSLRFLPALYDEARRIILAQRLRGLRIKGIKGTFRAFRYLLSPLIIDSLRTARRIAMAAELRAYSGQRTPIRTLTFARADWIVLLIVFIITLTAFGQRLGFLL